MKLSYGEKAAVRMLRRPDLSARRTVMVLDALAERDELRMKHVLAVVARCKRIRAAQRCGMTKDGALAFLRQELENAQAACCYHQDEYGAHYDPKCQGELDGLEAVLETVERLHTTEFVSEWIAEVHDIGDDSLAERWREEMTP